MIVKEHPHSTAPLVDTTDGTVIYEGWYNTENPGFTAASTALKKAEAKFKIRKKALVGNVWTEEWADGDQNYNHIWDNRASLNYEFLS